MKIKAEYLWIDGQQPTAELRNKTKILDVTEGTEIKNYIVPEWGFDGSSTEQAPGNDSDRVLRPIRVYSDPIRGEPHVIVLNEVFHPNGEPHSSNTRFNLHRMVEKHVNKDFLFGIEQEYTLFKDDNPLGWPTENEPAPQGRYYCATGTGKVAGREIVEKHLDSCLLAEIGITGINAEVMLGQWEYQIGTSDPLKAADDLWVARYLMERIAEDYDVEVSLAAKPRKGDWNGTGAHTNFSTIEMREGKVDFENMIAKLGRKHEGHIAVYGTGIEDRLTGKHETCRYDQFKGGISDRGASIRTPWQVHRDGKGYLEDRRPCADMDPYQVLSKIIKTVSED